MSLMIILLSCGSKLPESYHMDKRYWDYNDYEAAIIHIEYSTTKDEGYPRISDPLTAPVFYKLVNKENVSVVLQDEKLGLKYRDEAAQKFFDVSNDLVKIYRKQDIQDKFVYPVELVKAIEFSLTTQLLYFKVGNDRIRKDALNPQSEDTKRVLLSNEQIIVDNFTNDIELLRKEDAFNEEAIQIYAGLIHTYYDLLMKEFPNANYTKMKRMAITIEKRVKSEKLKSAMEILVKKIDAKQSKIQQQ